MERAGWEAAEKPDSAPRLLRCSSGARRLMNDDARVGSSADRVPCGGGRGARG